MQPVPGNQLETSGEAWYLPIFCVQHKKKLKPRLVHDASAKYKGVSLNDVLLQGPDLNNHLRGVLTRFREKPFDYSADIRDMFHNYQVPEDSRDFLRFYWFKYNDTRNPLVPYRSMSQLFGCTSSPAVASYGLKLCASSLSDYHPEARYYLENSFYVNDGLLSTDTVEEAISVLQTSIDVLESFKIRLHKIASNDTDILLQSMPLN